MIKFIDLKIILPDIVNANYKDNVEIGWQRLSRGCFLFDESKRSPCHYNKLFCATDKNRLYFD